MISLASIGEIINRNTLELYGKSTDDKPIETYKSTGIPTGSTFFEVDTSTTYYYDEANKEWHKSK